MFFPPAKAISRVLFMLFKARSIANLALFSEFRALLAFGPPLFFQSFLLINSKTEYRLQSPLEVRYWRCSEVCRHRCIAGGFGVGLTAPAI